MPERRYQNRKRNKQRILEAASTIILREGIESLSVRKLAKASKLALRTIYNLYENKGNVIIAIAEQGTRGIGKATTELEKAMIQGPWTTAYLNSWIDATEQVFLSNRDLLKPAILASTNLDQASAGSVRKIHQRRIKKVQGTLEIAAEKGLIWKDLDLEVIARLMYQNYFQVAVQWAEGHLDDRELIVHGRYTILTILHTLINEQPRRENVLTLLRGLKEKAEKS